MSKDKLARRRMYGFELRRLAKLNEKIEKLNLKKGDYVIIETNDYGRWRYAFGLIERVRFTQAAQDWIIALKDDKLFNSNKHQGYNHILGVRKVEWKYVKDLVGFVINDTSDHHKAFIEIEKDLKYQKSYSRHILNKSREIKGG